VTDGGVYSLVAMLIGLGIAVAVATIKRPTKGIMAPDWNHQLVARRFLLDGAPAELTESDLRHLHLWPQQEVIETTLSAPDEAVRRVLSPMYGPNSDRYREQIAQLHLPGPPGSTMRADGTGLTIPGGRLLPWSALAIDTIDFRSANRNGPFLYVQSLLLAGSDASIQLDWYASSNGRAFVDNVCRWLMANAASPSPMASAAATGAAQAAAETP
jgi:hypothetical protein